MEKKQKILCVDDEHINLLILKKILGKKYDIITAINAFKALEILNEDPEIELVISDMSMPDMNGLELIKEASNRYNNKKYFMFSGYAITDEIQDALNNNLIVDYFQKPANFEQIDKSISEHID
jgi:DNA-binding NtrC family response regulator